MSQVHIVLAVEDTYLRKIWYYMQFCTHIASGFHLTAHYMQLCGSCHKFVTPLMSKVKNLETIRDI